MRNYSRVLFVFLAFVALSTARAETKNWIGGDGDYAEGANWSPAGMPGAADDVVINGAVNVTYSPTADWTVNANASLTISGGARLTQVGSVNPLVSGALILDGGTIDSGSASEFTVNGSLTIQNGGALVCSGTLKAGNNIVLNLVDGVMPRLNISGNYTPKEGGVIKFGEISVGGEFQPRNGTVLDGADWICQLFAPQTENSVITLRSGSIRTKGTNWTAGFWQSGSTHIDFESGTSASFTFGGKIADAYSKTFGNSRFTYAGSRLTQDDFEALFTVTETDGKVTVSAIGNSETAPKLGDVSINLGAIFNSVRVTAAFEKLAVPADVYLVWDVADNGRKLESWANRQKIGTATGLSLDETVTLDGVTPGAYFTFRLVAVNADDESDASSSVSFVMRVYDVEGVVNEWIGGTGNWKDGQNWSLGHKPTGDEIVWIEDANAVITRSGQGVLVLNGSFAALRSGSPQQAVGGVYGDGTIDIRSGGSASYIFYSTGTVYSDTFKGNKFKFNGLKISEEEFEKRFVYTQGDVDPGKEDYYAYTISLKPSEGEPKVTATEVAFVDGKVVFSATLAEDSIDDTVVTVYYGLVDRGATAEGWDAHATIEGEGSGLSCTADVETGYRYYYAIAASSETADMTIWLTGDVVAADLPTDTLVWLGVSSDASDTRNWAGGLLPGATDVVEINELFAKSTTINWSVAAIPVVAGWKQDAGLVSFDTTRETPLTIAGDVTLSGKVNWTCPGPADDPVSCVNVAVAGDMTVGADVMIQTGTAKENDGAVNPRGYKRGPGYTTREVVVVDEETGEETTTTVYYGAAYAGDGGHRPYSGVFNSYGSILDPMDWGSAGKGDNDNSFAGPGLVKLVVGGALTLDGKIQSHGFGWDAQKAGASGGTVNITAAHLTGSGELDADGGRCVEDPGSGGRIRVRLTAADATFDGFPAGTRIHANPGSLTNVDGASLTHDVVLGAAGTICLQTAADGTDEGRIVVSDTNSNRRDATDPTSLVSATHLPARLNTKEDLRKSDWRLEGHGKLRLTALARIRSLALTDTMNQKVFLDGNTLEVLSLTVNGASVKSGSYAAAALNAMIDADVFAGEGQVIVGRKGLAVVIR